MDTIRLGIAFAAVLVATPAAAQGNAALQNIISQEGTWAKALPESAPKIDPFAFAQVSREFIPEGGPGFWIHQDTGPESAPFAAVGDQVTLYDPSSGETIQRTIAARQRFESDGNYYDGGIIGGGWAFLTRDTQVTLREDHDWSRAVTSEDPSAPPAPGPLSPEINDMWYVVRGAPEMQPRLGGSPAQEEKLRQAVASIYRSLVPEIARQYASAQNPETGKPWTEAQIRERVTSSIESFMNSGSEQFAALQGPTGPLYVTSIYPFDPANGEDEGYAVTLILDAQGGVVHRESGARDVVGRGDLDGDGVEEILFGTGTGRWDGNRWILPEPVPYAWH